MILFVSGLLIFLAVHSISIVARPWRDEKLASLGEPVWKGLYTVISLAAFALMCHGYGMTRLEPVVLYQPPGALRHLALALFLPVFPLVLCVYLPGRLKATAKHPLLVATKLWALAHLLVNGALADVLLFGGFLAWAVVDRIAVKKRPETVIVLGPQAMRNDLIAIAGGVLVYAIFVFWLHRALIGVAPL
ncbi:MAG: NnrU family protein [Gammaproteobacteria bacterium]|nr:NnrU family protein [Gammaproteobacteria bacterium]